MLVHISPSFLLNTVFLLCVKRYCHTENEWPVLVCPWPECGGKMHLREGEFEKAHTDFFEAFKNYDESGSPRRTTCLKYLVLANMLMKSGINPFDSQEVWKSFYCWKCLILTTLHTLYVRIWNVRQRLLVATFFCLGGSLCLLSQKVYIIIYCINCCAKSDDLCFKFEFQM